MNNFITTTKMKTNAIDKPYKKKGCTESTNLSNASCRKDGLTTCKKGK